MANVETMTGAPQVEATPHATRSSILAVIAPLGRVLFAAIFVMSGFTHFSQATVGYAASSGVPLASVLVPFSGVLAIVGGLSVAIGLRARWGALLLAIFLVPVTLSMHAFWSVSDPAAHMAQQAHFMKNVALLGCALLVAWFGSGPYSIDHHDHA